MILGGGVEASLFTDIIFWVIAISSIIAAIAVVQLKDLFRAALFLVVSFLGVAGLFVLLRAEFLAAVQLVIYVGAISVLVIFAVLMTADVEEGNPSHRFGVPVGIIAALFGAVAIFVVVATDWNLLEKSDAINNAAVSRVFENTIPTIASLLMRNFVLAFEIASVVLLAAIIGALALIRER